MSTKHVYPTCGFMIMWLYGTCAMGQIQLNLSHTDQQLLGFGAQVWPGDVDAHNILSELNARYARLQHGGNFGVSSGAPSPKDDNLEPGDNFGFMKNFISNTFSPARLADTQSTATWATDNGVELILNEFRIPTHIFLGGGDIMQTNRVDDFATYWGAILAYLDDNGVRPAYIELANEPNGDWDGYISPENYNTLVKNTRQVLDQLAVGLGDEPPHPGFDEIGIIGPGLSEFQLAPNWVNALDTTAVNGLAGWSTHTWDDELGIDAKASDFETLVHGKDPDKPIFITEYATDIKSFNGTSYTSPDDGGNAADVSAFAVQVFSNTLSLVNHGAGALLYWEAGDQIGSIKRWGLESEDGQAGPDERRPSFYALQTLVDRVRDDATVVEQTWSDDPDVTVAAFLQDDQLIVALANTTVQSQTRTLDFVSSGDLQFVEGKQFEATGEFTFALSDLADPTTGGTITVNLPGQSTQTLVFNNFSSTLPGDLNGDTVVDGNDFLDWQLGYANGLYDGDDLAEWQANYVTPSTATAASSTSAVPEPATWLLAGLTAILASACARRRMSHPSP